MLLEQYVIHYTYAYSAHVTDHKSQYHKSKGTVCVNCECVGGKGWYSRSSRLSSEVLRNRGKGLVV